MIPVRASGERAWTELTEALRTTTPACSGDCRFRADNLGDDELEVVRRICGRCPIAAECRAYAMAGRPEAGVWAGRRYGPRSLTDEEPPVVDPPRPPGVNGTPAAVSEPLPSLSTRSQRPTAPAADRRGTTGQTATTERIER